MTTQQFTAMSAQPEKALNGLRDPNALHVLLGSPKLPMHCVVFDGEKYWMFNACIPNGWATRFEFPHNINHLNILPSYNAFGLNLPFKIRNLDGVGDYQNWCQYHAQTK